MTKKFLKRILAASLATSALTFTAEIYFTPIISVVHAEVKTYTGVGESIISDRETIDIGKQGAKLQAIRNAQEKAGVFISSYSVMRDHALETDEVIAFTAGVVKINDNIKYEPIPLGDDLETIKYRATVTVTIDTDDLTTKINQWLGINSQDRLTLTERNRDLNNTLDRIQTRTAEIETAVAGATTDTEKIQAEIKELDKDILYAQKVSEGNEFLRRGDRASAMRLYQEAIAIYPKDATIAYEKLGDSYLEAKDYARAIDAYTKVIQMDPNYAVPYFKYGKIYFDRKEYRKALTDLKKANEIAPNSRQVRELLYKIYLELDDLDSALAFHDGSHLYTAKAEECLRLMIEATKEIESGQNLADNYVRRGHRYYQLGKMERAIQDFDKVIELDPNYVGAYFARGFVYYKQKQYEQAIKDFDKVIQFKGHWGLSVLNSGIEIHIYYCSVKCEVYSYICECYEKLGYKSKAIEIYTKALQETGLRNHKRDKQEFKKRIAELESSK